ncbi:MAG TPA: ATP-binding cassette domain-containing protein [Chitinispirillaceae bacterium]|nr:ATP-binding cassette domain-containing protein [Chitinispirillaceae bacterium]
MITFKDVWLWQEMRPVIKGVSLNINLSEKVAILGPSGSGKTTILKLILGLLVPDSGQVLFDNIDLAALKEDKLDKIRLQFSIVFQEGALFDSLTVRENVAFYFREHTSFDFGQINEQVDLLLRTVDLQSAAELMPEKLSGGMKRRVAIARSLAVSGAQMFLYDEPTSGLDPVNADIIRGLICDAATNGKGFIIVTHEIFDALSMASRFMFLKDGQILFDGVKDTFLNSQVPQLMEFLHPYKYILDKL